MTISDLVDRQLEAYNRADLDAFCACYAEDVVVLDETGRRVVDGMVDFRARYAELFERCRDVRAELTQRVVHGDHEVDLERWSRVRRDTEEHLEGDVLVRYTARDGLIAWVCFLR